jgi:hypothetical protein
LLVIGLILRHIKHAGEIHAGGVGVLPAQLAAGYFFMPSLTALRTVLT